MEAAAGRPLVLVILSGGPLDVSFAKEDPRIQSIVWAGYPGMAGGQAIADVIFGLINPGLCEFSIQITVNSMKIF